MIDKLSSSQIDEFERLHDELTKLPTPEERNRRLSELKDPALLELLQGALELPVSGREVPPGTRLDGYELVERLGGGGFGEVWQARRVDGQAPDVAIKLVRSEHLRLDDASRYVELFQEEIRRHTGLEHEGIVRLISAGSVILPGFSQPTPFLVMELCRGAPLHHACRGLRTEEKIRCMIQVCDAVQYAHRHGLMHLDLKPENILVMEHSDGARVKILDFGLARAFRADQPFDPRSFGAGTLPYKAPEQIDRTLGGEDFRTDVHAIGVLSFQVLTDRLPYPLVKGTSAEYRKFILEGPRLKLSEFDRSLDPGLQTIVTQAIDIERSRRYDSPARLSDALQRWRNSRTPARKRHALVLLAVVVILTLIAILAIRRPSHRGIWRKVPIWVKGDTKPWDSIWHCLMWSGNEGWLAGAIDQGNGANGTYIGRGVLLHTLDGGRSWAAIGATNFDAGAGTLGRFGGKKWNGIGPIVDISIDKRLQSDGGYLTNGWIASQEGIYLTTNAGSPAAQWQRTTPRPDGEDCYSYFSGIVNCDGHNEIYAFGWQGIAHWEKGGQWAVQLRTLAYNISKLYVSGGDNRDAWALSNGADPPRRAGDQSHGALYHLARPGTNWEQMPLTDINLRPGQGLSDIIKLRYSETLLVIGEYGLILRGSLEGTNRLWQKVTSHTKWDLSSITYDNDRNLWIVGEHGLVLQSQDDGEAWVEIPCLDSNGSRVTDPLSRVVFDDGNRGWILGAKSVLKYERPPQNR